LTVRSLSVRRFLTSAGMAWLLIMARCSGREPACGFQETCNCADGTSIELGCPASGNCGDACASHGGVEPQGQCGAGETYCGGQCADLDAGIGGYYCGACDVICPLYTSCASGACRVSLPADAGRLRFGCRGASDCASGEDCVLNASTNCPPFCATLCVAQDGGLADGGSADAGRTCRCGAALDVETSAHLSVCIPEDDGC